MTALTAYREYANRCAIQGIEPMSIEAWMEDWDEGRINRIMLCYIVFNTTEGNVGDLGIATPSDLTSPKIISYLTPVIYGIMSLTVNSVKMAFFDNLVSEKGY